MRPNEIRFYLHSYDNLQKEIAHLNYQLKTCREMGVSSLCNEKYMRHPLAAQVLSDMPIYHDNSSKTENLALKRLEYIVDLENEIDSKMRLLRAINSVYFYLQEPARSIIELRYMRIPQGRPKPSWKEIAGEVNETEENCKVIDTRTIRKIQLCLQDTEKERKKKNTA